MFWQSDKDDRKTFTVLVHIDAKNYHRFGSDRIHSFRPANSRRQHSFEPQQTHDGDSSTNSLPESPHQRQESNLPSLEKTPRRRNGSNRSNTDNKCYNAKADQNSGYTSLLMPVLSTPLRSKSDIGQRRQDAVFCKEGNPLVSCIEEDHSDCDAYDTDGDSVGSIEHFEPTTMQIEKRNGIINLVYKKVDGEENQQQDEDVLEAKGQQQVKPCKRDIDTSIRPPSRVPSVEDDLSLLESNHSVKSLITRSVITRSNTPFELISTKNQTHKDCKQKEFHQIKKACLDAAAEAYKSAGVEIPDVSTKRLNTHSKVSIERN